MIRISVFLLIFCISFTGLVFAQDYFPQQQQSNVNSQVPMNSTFANNYFEKLNKDMQTLTNALNATKYKSFKNNGQSITPNLFTKNHNESFSGSND